MLVAVSSARVNIAAGRSWKVSPWCLGFTSGANMSLIQFRDCVNQVAFAADSEETAALYEPRCTLFQFARPQARILALFLDVVKGVDAMHEKGMLHTDLKLENAMLHCQDAKSSPTLN